MIGAITGATIKLANTLTSESCPDIATTIGNENTVAAIGIANVCAKSSSRLEKYRSKNAQFLERVVVIQLLLILKVRNQDQLLKMG